MNTFGVDILVDRANLGEAELRDTLAAVGGVPKTRVWVITDVADYPARGQADVVCTVSSVDGQFPTLLSVDGLPGRTEDVLPLVDCLSSALSAVCLTGTSDANPYAMWRVEPKQPWRSVFLVADAADSGRYDIDQAQPGVSFSPSPLPERGR